MWKYDFWVGYLEVVILRKTSQVLGAKLVFQEITMREESVWRCPCSQAFPLQLGYPRERTQGPALVPKTCWLTSHAIFSGFL